MRRKVVLLAVMLLFQLVWIGKVAGAPEYSTKYAINYDSNFESVASYWGNSTWNPHEPADNWMEAENGIVTLYYKANRTDWGNTEVYQGKKPAFEIKKSLRFRNFLYREGSGGLNLSAKVRRDIDPVWQGPSLSLKSPYPQANIGIYLWLEINGWDYDEWNKTSSLIIDVYFDSRHQDPSTSVTMVSNIDDSYFQNGTPYDPQIHAGYVKGILPLDSWQVFEVDVAALIDQTLQKCRNDQIVLPSSEVFIKFFGVYVDSFSAAVQASFDYVLLRDTSNEEIQIEMGKIEKELNNTKDQIANITRELDSIHVELENVRNIMYILVAAAIISLTTTIYFAIKKPKKETMTS